MRIAALIIAREGSKRLPGKNVREFCGKPMFQWNLEKAIELFPEVYVSSDSSFILDRVRDLGAIAIRRPAELAGDNVPHMPVFLHALPLMRNPDVLVSIQSNSPTLEKRTIEKALSIIQHPEIHEVTTIDPQFKVHGSVWALKRDRIEHYGDPYVYKAEVFLRDDAVDIHTFKDFQRAEKYFKENV